MKTKNCEVCETPQIPKLTLVLVKADKQSFDSWVVSGGRYFSAHLLDDESREITSSLETTSEVQAVFKLLHPPHLGHYVVSPSLEARVFRAAFHGDDLVGGTHEFMFGGGRGNGVGEPLLLEVVRESPTAFAKRKVHR